MNLKLSILELLDLQLACRRAVRESQERLQYYDPEKHPACIENCLTEVERFGALHERLEALFESHYPPADGAAA